MTTSTNGKTEFAGIQEIRTLRGQGDEVRVNLQPPSDVVESLLYAVHSDPDKRTVTLSFRQNAHEFTLRATGAERLLVNEYLMQNVVDEARVLGQDCEPKELRDLLATLLYDQAAASEIVEPAFISKIELHAASVLEGRCVLLTVVPVIGASVLLLARTLEWVDHG